MEDGRIQLELADRISLELFGLMHCPPNWTGSAHIHPFWELVYLSRPGTAAQAGDLYLIPPQRRHRFDNSGGQLADVLYLGFEFTAGCACSDDEAQERIRRCGICPWLLRQAEDLCGILRTQGAAGLQASRGRAMLLLSSLTDALFADGGGEEKTDGGAALVRRICRYFRDNLGRPVSVQELGEMFYLSPNYLGDLFKSRTGMSLKAYQNKLRMEQAFLLLSGSRCTVTEVADQLGFQSVQYFSRRFKEYYRINPSDIHKQL